MDQPTGAAHDAKRKMHQQDPEVLNDHWEAGTIGHARSSGGAAAAQFIEPGMDVISSEGTLVGVVEGVENDMIRLRFADPDDGSPRHIPLMLVDGVDDRRVILSSRGDASFGLGAAP